MVKFKFNFDPLFNYYVTKIVPFNAGESSYRGPLLLIRAAPSELIVDMNNFKKVYPHLKDEDIYVFKKGSHWLPYEYPNSVSRVFIQFLKKHERKF